MDAPRKTDAAEFLRDLFLKNGLSVTKLRKNQFFVEIDGKPFQIVVRIPRETKEAFQNPADVERPSKPPQKPQDQPESKQVNTPPSSSIDDYAEMEAVGGETCASCQDDVDEGARIWESYNGRDTLCEVCVKKITSQ